MLIFEHRKVRNQYGIEPRGCVDQREDISYNYSINIIINFGTVFALVPDRTVTAGTDLNIAAR